MTGAHERIVGREQLSKTTNRSLFLCSGSITPGSIHNEMGMFYAHLTQITFVERSVFVAITTIVIHHYYHQS